MKPAHVSRSWDAYAASFSTLCVVHCLAVPVLLAVLPTFPAILDNHLIHVLLVLLAAPITLRVVWGAIENKESMAFVVSALFGLALLVSAITFVPHELEVTLTVCGGVSLAGAHIWRWTRHQTITTDHNV